MVILTYQDKYQFGLIYSKICGEIWSWAHAQSSITNKINCLRDLSESPMLPRKGNSFHRGMGRGAVIISNNFWGNIDLFERLLNWSGCCTRQSFLFQNNFIAILNFADALRFFLRIGKHHIWHMFYKMLHRAICALNGFQTNCQKWCYSCGVGIHLLANYFDYNC